MKTLNEIEFNQTIVDINDTNSVYKGDKIAIVDFYADWCGPCKVLGPRLEEIQKENSESVDLYKVDVDSNQSLASKFGIRSIPTVLYFKLGKRNPLVTLGAVSKSEILSVIEELRS